MDILIGLLCVTSFGYALYRLLKVSEDTDEPQLLHTNPMSDQIKHIINACPVLKEKYEPPWLWGKNGHLQTVLSSKYPGRFNPTRPVGEHLYLKVSDGATFSFDLYQPTEKTFEDDVTMLVSPGFSSTSESPYIFSFVHTAVTNGYRVAVLNHLGSVVTESLTSSRIFTYGCTEEIRALVQWILSTYPCTRLIGIGYSMGANILLKFLGEDEANQDRFLCCISIQQGYDIDLALRHLFVNTRRIWFYNFVLVKKYKRLLRCHYRALFDDPSSEKDVNFWRIMMATSIQEIDREFTCKVSGFSDVEEYYKDSSSSNFMEKIKLPMLCLNAEDDPVCPVELLRTPTQLAAVNEKFLFVKTKHGGHLGYFERGLFIPNTVTWCDRLILQYSNAIRTSTQSDQSLRCALSR